MKILKIGAVWCTGCIVMKPLWKEIEEKRPDLVTEYFDADEHPEIIEKFNIKDFPMFIFLDNAGNELHREWGEVPKDKLINLITKYENA
jgi:thiol-disulfide isomerase/thioredoxin